MQWRLQLAHVRFPTQCDFKRPCCKYLNLVTNSAAKWFEKMITIFSFLEYMSRWSRKVKFRYTSLGRS